MIGTLGEQSLEFVRRLKEVRPTAKVIVLTDDVDVDEFIAVVVAGADSYIGKDSSLEQLMQSFKAVNLGGCVFECGVCGAALRKLVDNQRDDVVFDRDHIDLSGLSNRERQVAELLSRGHSNKEIASALSISVSTTKTHVSKVFRHFGVTCRRQMLPKLYRLADLIGPAQAEQMESC